MAGQSKSIDVSIKQLLNSSVLRTGDDLSISMHLSGDTETVLLKDYFLTSPDLETTNGILKGNIVNLLAKNSQPLDQGMVAFEDPQAIGKITTSDGAISVQRLDQSIQLNEGDFIYLNDIVKSNASAVGIAFADETTMSVDPNSTMVIDDFVYDPENPTAGSMNANILEGNFSFVSGKIAKVGNDAMTVTTPVLTIGVRGTQVAGKANTDGEDNEIVLLPNNDGTVGQIMIANQSGEVLLTKPYEATIIANAYVAPTVPVVLLKSEVLKKFATTISTTRKTEAKAEVERDTEEAVREKEKAEDEQEELEEEKEELEEEAEALEEEKGELEENIEELEEEAEEAEKEAEELEDKVEEAIEEKQEAEDKKEEVAEEIEQLEEELAEASTQEKQAIEKELEKLEEEFVEIAEEVQELEQEIEVVEEAKAVVDKKVEEIEKEFVEAKEDFVEIEQKVEIVEKEVQQVIEKELVIEQEILMVEQKFEAIVEKFEVFQEEYVQEFEDFIPEAEIKQFLQEAPEELVKDFQEDIIEKLEEENEIIRIEKEVEEQELQEKSEEDPFSEENVEEKLEEIDDGINELKETEQELNDKGKQLQNVEEELREEQEELEKESREIQEKGEALNEKNRELEEREQQAIEDGDREALEELQQEFDALDKEQNEVYKKSQELDKEFDAVSEQFQDLSEEYQDLSSEYQELDQEFREFDDMANNNNFFYGDDNKELDIKTGMDEFNSQVRPEDQVLVDVDDFIAQEKANVLENSEYAQEAENFFSNDNVLLNNDISQQVQDLIVINFQYIDEYVLGVGHNINTLDDYENDQWGDDDHIYDTIDANAELYQLSLESDYWFDLWVQQQVADNINVAPWLNLQGDVTKAEATAVDSLLFSFGASDANGDRLTYSIFNDPTGKLRIEGQNVYLNEAFSVTDDTLYQIVLKVQDPYGASDVDHIYLTVENNHAPVISQDYDISKAENVSVGEDIASIPPLSASDAEGETIAWSITAGNDSNLFTINSSTGLIETAAALDYETATSHTLTVTATDAFGNTSTVNQVVNVTNVNEAPTISSMNAVSLAENVSSGTSVATASASDVDAGTTLTYSITSGNDAGHFAINSSTGAITTAASLDYETTTSYTLAVTASDGTLTTSTNQVINITDVADDANDPAGWVTAGDGSAGAYKQKIAYAGPSSDGAGIIAELGHTAEDYTANNLSTYDVVAYYNTSNSGFVNSPFSSALTSWVNDGGVFVMYDRRVNDSQNDSKLPGHNGNVTTTRDNSQDNAAAAYQIVDESTSNLLKHGPGGIMVDDTTEWRGDVAGDHSGNNHLGTFNIGGGNSTNHGYMSNLDSDVLGLATRDADNKYVDAVWEHGEGAVYYSTTPLDHYIGNNFAENDAWDAYALNSLHYATSMIFDGYSVLNGTSSADRMYGTTGDDTFAPGTGSDEIWTGGGSDVIKYTALNQSDLDGDNDVIIDYTIGSDSIDISAITGGASISRTLTNSTLFKIDYNNDGTYDMQWDLDDYTGTADQVTVVT